MKAALPIEYPAHLREGMSDERLARDLNLEMWACNFRGGPLRCWLEFEEVGPRTMPARLPAEADKDWVAAFDEGRIILSLGRHTSERMKRILQQEGQDAGTGSVVIKVMALATIPVVCSTWSSPPAEVAGQPPGRRRPLTMSLPPGQHDYGIFPRFGIPFWEPLPPITQPPSIQLAGAVRHRLQIPVASLAELPRRQLVADLHCVTGWSVRGLHWSGFAFRELFETVILRQAGPEAGVTHVLFQGADGFNAVLTLEDALDEDVLVADQLGGSELGSEHGAPVRLVSPKQYAYKSVKHLCGIELHSREPGGNYRTGNRRRFLRWLVTPHPRARVAAEERHSYLPPWIVRGLYRNVLRPFWLWGFRRCQTSTSLAESTERTPPAADR